MTMRALITSMRTKVKSSHELFLNGRKFILKAPAVMGILNLTPDSFSDGGQYMDVETALKRADVMIAEGAQIIDIGAESTRPGSDSISIDEELRRLMPVLDKVCKRNCIVSVDSNKIEVQREALKVGAHIINDIMGGSEALFEEAQRYQAGLVIMHTPAAPKEMQNHTKYKNLIDDLISYFEKKQTLLENYKIPLVYFDPGIGFGKTFEQSLDIMRNLERFSVLKYPRIIGSSRKSWIGKLYDAGIDERLGASLASIICAYHKGAEAFRVHDVKESVQALMVAKELLM
jgi:dihydropteroate synthase